MGDYVPAASVLREYMNETGADTSVTQETTSVICLMQIKVAWLEIRGHGAGKKATQIAQQF
jgi:hypothetical protein